MKMRICMSICKSGACKKLSNGYMSSPTLTIKLLRLPAINKYLFKLT